MNHIFHSLSIDGEQLSSLTTLRFFGYRRRVFNLGGFVPLKYTNSRYGYVFILVCVKKMEGYTLFIEVVDQ